jgi:hypothetical protein
MDGQATGSHIELGPVTGYVAGDHDRLHAIAEEVVRHVCGREWGAARAAQARLAAALDRHVRMEEEVLSPLFEARTGLVDGPTVVLRGEHREMRKALVLMLRGIETEDEAAFHGGFRFLGSVLPEHYARTGRVLCPTIDRVLAPAESAAVLARLERD